jgi:hypothetical protein
MARAIRAALDSRAALGDDIAPRLRELLPPLRLWGLAVVLASWELSRAERNRAALSAVLSGSGVPSFWGQLDLFAGQLAPFVQASRDATSPEEATEAALRFLDAVGAVGLPLVRQVVQSRAFRVAAEVIGRDLPETEKPPARAATTASKATTARTTSQAEAPSVEPSPDWRPGSPLAEREETATAYLIFLGWPRADVERFLGGKR